VQRGRRRTLSHREIPVILTNPYTILQCHLTLCRSNPAWCIDDGQTAAEAVTNFDASDSNQSGFGAGRRTSQGMCIEKHSMLFGRSRLLCTFSFRKAVHADVESILPTPTTWQKDSSYWRKSSQQRLCQETTQVGTMEAE
jgi:hypothetical protein